MQRKILLLSVLGAGSIAASLTGLAQQGQGTAAPAQPAPAAPQTPNLPQTANPNQNQNYQNLPPGLQNRQQLPPGLNRRDTLPPGLDKRVDGTDPSSTDVNRYGNNDVNTPVLTPGTDTNTFGQADTNRWGFGNGTNFLGQAGTNLQRFGTNLSRWGTNAYQHLTNAWTGLSNRFQGTNFTPTGGATNRIYSTNSISITNRFSLRDEASTPADQQLLMKIHQVCRPVLQERNRNSPWMPVHFQCREGIVHVVGFVPDEDQHKTILTLVREVPGVVQVTDELQVQTQVAANGTGQPMESVPAGGQLAIQDQAFSANDQHLLVTLRQQVQTVVGSSEPLVPVHFLCRDGVVTLVGFVPNEQQRQQIFELVQRTPGVVQVNNQLQVNVQATAAGGAAGGGLTNQITSGNPGSVGGAGGVGAGAGAGGGSGLQNTNQLGANLGGTNSISGGSTNLTPTGRTNIQGQGQDRVYPNQSTNQTGVQDTNSQNSNLPPGLQKRDTLPPGLEKRQDLPPGLEKRQPNPNPSSGSGS